MKKAFLFGILIGISAAAQEPVLRWEAFHPPAYPHMARVAHLHGQIILRFTLQPDGSVAVQESTGHPILRQAAEESLKTSKLRCDDCRNLTPIFTVNFDFQIADHDCREPEIKPIQQVSLKDAGHVLAIVQPFCTSDPLVHYKRVRSPRCLYLWRCARHPL
jgi:hypothetical protein